jgi:hypothetical protein
MSDKLMAAGATNAANHEGTVSMAENGEMTFSKSGGKESLIRILGHFVQRIVTEASTIFEVSLNIGGEPTNAHRWVHEL